MRGIWVNGVAVADADGVLDTGARPGRAMREFAAQVQRAVNNPSRRADEGSME